MYTQSHLTIETWPIWLWAIIPNVRSLLRRAFISVCTPLFVRLSLRALSLLGSLAAAGWIASLLVLPTPAVEAATPHFTVIARGLDNPRGIAFGPEGALFVAEAGRGGAGPCTTFDLFGGPVCFGPTGAVTRVLRGNQQRVATGLGSFAHPDGGFAFGVHDVAVQGEGRTYVTVGGCFGLVTPALGKCGGLFRLRPGGASSLVADLNAYEVQNHPDGTRRGESDPYDVIALPGERIVADAAGNDVLRVGGDGQVSLVAVFKQRLVPAPASLDLPPGTLLAMDSVPDTLAVGPDGALYVGELTGFPFPIGGARIYRLVPDQAPQIFADGFTNIIDMAFDGDGNLLVLEIARNSLLSNDQTGALIRLNRDGSRTTLLSDALQYPTGLAIRDAAVYISNCGTCPGTGQVLRVSFGDTENHGGGV
jgi:hypothetical protein